MYVYIYDATETVPEFNHSVMLTHVGLSLAPMGGIIIIKSEKT